MLALPGKTVLLPEIAGILIPVFLAGQGRIIPDVIGDADIIMEGIAAAGSPPAGTVALAGSGSVTIVAAAPVIVAAPGSVSVTVAAPGSATVIARSEERRVGKECRL